MAVNTKGLPSDEVPADSDHMWPLDLALVALGASLMFMAASRLGWDDPRWLYNAKTYAVAIPLGLVAIDLLLRNFASRFVQRSMQFGFLVSMFVHLVLLIVAVNVVIFARYWPEAVVGVQPDRAPVRRTLPDSLFRPNPEAVTEQQDWSRPVEAESAARINPIETQQIERLEDVAQRLEMPNRPEQEHQPRPFFVPREQESPAQPNPADTRSRLARHESNVRAMDVQREAIEAPDVPQQQDVQQSISPLNMNIARSRPRGAQTQSTQAAPSLPAASAREHQIQRPVNQQQDAPQVSVNSQAAAIERQTHRTQRDLPSLSAPAAPTINIARDAPSHRLLSRETSGPPRRSTSTSGASLAPSESQAQLQSGVGGLVSNHAVSGQRNSSATGASQSQPMVSAGSLVMQSPLAGRGRNRSPTTLQGVGSTGQIAVPQGTIGGANSGTTDSQETTGTGAPTIAASSDTLGRSTTPSNSANLAMNNAASLNINADPGPAGLGRELAPRVGFSSDSPADQPMVAIQPNIGRFQRRQLGGHTAPPAQRVATVEPFQRRLMRTAGGAAPAPAGLVGPETEEAIERGLAYLAARQKDDGSWSLQGHGDDVILKSDTAATALCVLAFQGAGYTHLKHKYAGTVARAIAFLRDSQRPNGDLYKLEDAASNRNVWLYSHSIAALAMCEAYGMTKDSDLADPAQRSINFIVESQHPLRGGWRYQPRVSSDTSVTGWMMMALKSGELAGLNVPESTYNGIQKWLSLSQDASGAPHLFRYNPYALDTPAQRHGRDVTPTMTAVGLLIRLYMGWRRENSHMQAGAEYLANNLPDIGTPRNPKRDTYYWYYATQVMFHMGGSQWERWNNRLHPLLIRSQQKDGEFGGSWDPTNPIPDRWSPHAGRLYLTTMNLLSLEVYYRHLPIYEDTAR